MISAEFRADSRRYANRITRHATVPIAIDCIDSTVFFKVSVYFGSSIVFFPYLGFSDQIKTILISLNRRGLNWHKTVAIGANKGMPLPSSRM